MIVVAAAAAAVSALAANTTVASRGSSQPGTGADPTLQTVPARALSIGAAKAILAQMVKDKTIGAVEDSSIAPIGTRVTIPSTISGVSYQYQGRPIELHDIDARFAVLLARLAQYLSIKYGILVIRHLGIFPGNPSYPNDVHNMGRAVDLAGFSGGIIGDLDVASDWGQMPAPWTADATTTGYRLHPSDRGYEFFQDLYTWLATQAADRTDEYVVNEGPPTAIGDHSYIVTPDHPTPSLRAAHWNHVHAQIGPTRM